MTISDLSTLAGAQLWLRAKDNTGANGSSITTWADQSGTSHDGTSSGTAPIVETASTPLGGKSVRFNQNGGFTFSGLMSSATAGEMWLVIKTDGADCGAWTFSGDGQNAHYPYGGVIYESFGTASGRFGITPSMAITSWRIYRVKNDGTTWANYLDGVQQYSVGSIPVGFGSAPAIGISAGGWELQGNIAEVFIRSQISTSTEITDITAYLTGQHITAVGGAAALAGAATLTTVGTVVRLGDAALTAVTTLTDAAGVRAFGTDFVAAATLTTDASNTVMASANLAADTSIDVHFPLVPAFANLVAAATLTTDGTRGLPGAASMTAVSTLTAAADISRVGAAALVASASLSGDAATIITADVALVADTTLVAPALVVPYVPAALGAASLAVGPVIAVAALPQPGTLASPFPAADTDTRTLDFTGALYVSTDPVPVAAPPLSPSFWYVFTESQIADLRVSSGVTGGAVIEVYSGPPGATAADLTFIATDGVAPITLGAVTLAVGPAIIAGNIMNIDLGAVTVAAAPVPAGALT